MIRPDATFDAVTRIRRLRDLGGAAALGAAGVHTLLALVRGWPRTSWLDRATASIVVGVFALLVVLYATRWFHADNWISRRAQTGNARLALRLGPVVRASGQAVFAASFVGLAASAHGSWDGFDAAVRGYYAALLVLVLARWIVGPRPS